MNNKFICDKCKNPGIESIFQYKNLNICTKCANDMRFANKDKYTVELSEMTIYDKKKR